MTAEFQLPPRFRVLEVLQTDDVQVRLRVADEVLQRELVLELPGTARLAELDQGNQRARILREARMLAKVHHPGVQGILDVLEHAGVPILLLAPRQGRTLEDLLREQSRIEPAEVQRLAIQVALAAQAVHAAGVVHRDLREANILIGADGSCALTGFGFAKPQGSPFHGSSLNYGKRGGKEPSSRLLPQYPAPEQLRGAAADARTDVYGLGCVLAHCLTGTAPKPEQVVTAATLAQAAPQAPRRLLEVIAGCLAPAPSGRFPTMQAVAAALNEESTSAKTGNRRVLLAAAAMVAVSTTLLWAVATSGSGAEQVEHDGPRGRPTEKDLDVQQRNWYRRPHALVIGIGYEGAPGKHKHLPNAEGDARAIVTSLHNLGWPDQNVMLLIGADATRERIEKELETLRKQTVVQRDDQVFIYFAGHGESFRTDESGFLLPWDAGPSSRDGPTPANWMHMSGLVERLLTEIPADHVLVAFDCCHVTPGMVAAATRGDDKTMFPATTVRSFVQGRARLLIAATSATQLASDGRPGGHSPFCEVFLDCLDLPNDLFRSAKSIEAYLEARVPQGSHTGQMPELIRHRTCTRGSNFVFGHYPR